LENHILPKYRHALLAPRGGCKTTARLAHAAIVPGILEQTLDILLPCLMSLPLFAAFFPCPVFWLASCSPRAVMVVVCGGAYKPMAVHMHLVEAQVGSKLSNY